MMIRLALLLVALGFSPAIEARADEPIASGPTIRVVDNAFEVVGLDPGTITLLESIDLGAIDLLTVSVAGAEVPMLGRVRLDRDGEALRFEPRYTIRAGTTYRATFRPALLPGGDPDARAIEAELAIPEPTAAEPGRVLAIYPSADLLPENLLRFYLHFSAPMSRGDAYRRFRLIGPDDEVIDAAFLELDEELWDPTGTRLTVLIDPGRIKQGLVPRAELGPVLEAGRRYTLEIDADWPDATGRPLAAPARKHFRAGPPDESPPNPASWRLEPPPSGSRSPLVLRFPGPLDHALLGRLLTVADASGRPIPGRAEVGEGETRWSFTPDAPWRPGPYRLDADTDLEDPAGNGIGRPFEVDVFDRVEARVEARTATLPFRIEPASAAP